MNDPRVSKTMKAAVLTEFNHPYSITNLPIPRPGKDEYLIRIHAAGFCHSDLQMMHGERPMTLPMIPSHEPAGVIAEVGEDVTGDFKVGDRVGVLNFMNACKKCPDCQGWFRRKGRYDARFCPSRKTAGFKEHGAFAEYMVAETAAIVALPDEVSFMEAAPLMCAGATIWGAIEKVVPDLEPGDAIGIVGVGGLGYLGVQFVKALGFRAVAMDNRNISLDQLQQLPKPLQPSLTVNTSESSARENIMSYTAGEGLAAVIVSTENPAVNNFALFLLRIGGTLVPLGLPAAGWNFEPWSVTLRELTIKGNYVSGAESVGRMMQIVVRAGIKSHVQPVSFEEIPQIVEKYSDGNFKGRLVVNCKL